MRCEMFIWTIFSWLILLENVPLSFCSLCSEDYFEDQEIDFDQVSKAGATIKPLGTINVSSAGECAKSCCVRVEYVSEVCNIVIFSKHPTNSCTRYFCQPIEHCILKESSQHDHTIKLKLFDTTSSNSTSTSDLGTTSSTEFSTVQTTTDKTDLRVTTDIVNLNSVENTTIINNLTTEYVPIPNFTLIAESTTHYSAETKPNNDSSTLNTGQEGSYMTTDIDITSIPLDKATPSVYVGSSLDGGGNATLAMRENETEVTTVKDDTQLIFNVTVKTKLMTNNETDPQIFDVTVKTKLMFNNDTEQLMFNVSVTTGFPVDINKTEGEVTPAELSAESDQLRKDVHLIAALVIGLLLLLTVLGLVVRRFHDGWQRRHYQRMDFLIDGMYNSPPQ